PGGVTAAGVITVGRPTLVVYSWVHSGRIVDAGIVKVDGEKALSFAFTPHESQQGWVSLVVLSLYGADSAHDTYVVTCEEEPPPPPPVEATASVTAPEDYAGVCPSDRVFTGTVTVNRIDAEGTTVQYRWV